MPHQDKDGLRTPLRELKEILAPLAQTQLENVLRHGNTDFERVRCTAIWLRQEVR